MSRKRQTKKSRTVQQSGTPTSLKKDPSASADALDALLATRFHGSSNIRGVRFQLRYCVLQCATIAADHRRGAFTGTRLRFEGLEDLDTIGGTPGSRFRIAWDSELVQVKSSVAGWTWAGLAEPVANFLEAHRLGTTLRFRLVISFTPWGELAELVGFAEKAGAERSRVRARFRSLVKRIGGTVEEADLLLDHLVLEPIPEAELVRRTRSALADAAGAVDPSALDSLQAILAGHALAWAAERATVGAGDVLRALREAAEGMQRAERYAAVEHRWVGPVQYASDAAPGDFFAGKRVRIGHVVDQLDIRRPKWLERIAVSLRGVPVCVIRAPSGHGKSTLAFRYAIENWPASQTILVRAAGSADEVAAVSDYIRNRSGLGAPLRVLIDADFETRRWAAVAQAAAAAGAQVLVTVRTEDWQRYDLAALTSRDIIEPTLDLAEASEIFAAFKSRGHLHRNVRSAAEAYERLRAPHLLLEFVHLVTQGQMLQDRLRDQVRAFSTLGEDPAKKHLLRVVSLAHALGAPVPVRKLLAAIPPRDDPQDVLSTLIGEYVALDGNYLTPLHWVRSDHLSRVLHEGGHPPLADTAAEALELIPATSVPFFVANAFRREDLDRDSFLASLVERFGGAEPELLIAVLDGLFEAGERDFHLTNRALYESASQISGASGVATLALDTMPLLPVNLLHRLVDLARDRPHANAHALQRLRHQIQETPRGLDLVRGFLSAASPQIQLDRAGSGAGRLLDWCALTGVRLPDWARTRSHLLHDGAILGGHVDSVCDLAQGLFRYEREAYDIWFESVRSELLPYLQLETECVSLDLTGPVHGDANHRPDLELQEQTRRDVEANGAPLGEVAITYLVDSPSDVPQNEQSVRRLQTLRRALPFAGRYRAAGVQFLPGDLQPPIDDTLKAMPRSNLPFPSDVAKNVVSRMVVEAEFGAETYYELQRAWISLRSRALRLVESVGTILNALLERRPYSLNRILGPGEELVRLFESAAHDAPALAESDLERLGPLPEDLRAASKKGEPGKWMSHLQSFRQHFWAYTNARDEQQGRRAIHDFRVAQGHLAGMQEFFRVLFREHADHFEARDLDAREQSAYAHAEILLDGWISEPPEPGPGRVIDRLQARRRGRDADAIGRVRDALQALGPAAAEIVYPAELHRASYTRALPLGVPVQDPLQPFNDLLAVCAALLPALDTADVYWLFPLHQGSLVGPGAHHVSARLLRGEGSPGEESSLGLGLVFPIDPPEHIVALLPQLPRAELPKPNLRQRVAALALNVQWYVRQRDVIAGICDEQEGHPRLRELQEQLVSRLHLTREEIMESTRTIARDLGELLSASTDEAEDARAHLSGWIQDVAQAVSAGTPPGGSRARWDLDDLGQLAETADLMA
jgi:hypothetical protein